MGVAEELAKLLEENRELKADRKAIQEESDSWKHLMGHADGCHPANVFEAMGRRLKTMGRRLKTVEDWKKSVEKESAKLAKYLQVDPNNCPQNVMAIACERLKGFSEDVKAQPTSSGAS